MFLEILQVFLIAMLPVVELRGAIPYGILALKLPVSLTIIAAILGNLLPAIVILRFFDPVVAWIIKNFPWSQKHIEKYFQKLHHKHSEKFNRTGYLALVAFVAIPLPGTGAWTGSILASLFDLPKKPSFLAIGAGLFGAAAIITLFSDQLLKLLWNP